MDADVLIVGGGVGGAVLALALGRLRWRVTILERDSKPHAPTRPEILQAWTFTALDTLEIGDRLRSDASIPLEGFDIRQGERTLAVVSQEDLLHAGAAPRSVDPTRFRAAVLDAAVATGYVALRRGADVSALILDRDRAVGVRGTEDDHPFEQRARLVVGDDGGRSLVREALGISIALRPFPLEIATARFRRPADLPDTRARIWIGSTDAGGPLAAGFIPVPGGHSLLVMPCRAGTWDEMTSDPDRFWNGVTSTTPLAQSLRGALNFPHDFSRFRLSFGHAERYSARGGVLIGDAAHPMSPAGGQGANAAIADALALADIIGLALATGSIGDRDLREYERRRRPANVRSLAFSQRGARIIRWSRWLPGSSLILVALLRLVGRREGLKQQLLRQVATAFLERPGDDRST